MLMASNVRTFREDMEPRDVHNDILRSNLHTQITDCAKLEDIFHRWRTLHCLAAIRLLKRSRRRQAPNEGCPPSSS